MRRVKEKLHSRSGASILFAILIFMLCVLAGTAALTAAGANAGRYTHLEAEQQEYLSVASAVQLLKEEIVGMEYNASVTETVDGSTAIKTYIWTPDPPVASDSPFSGLFQDYFTSLFVTWTTFGEYPTTGYTAPSIDFGTGNLSKKTLTVTVKDNPDMGSVTVTLTADKNYRITVEVYSGSDTDKRNLTTMIFTVTPDYSQDVTTQTVGDPAAGTSTILTHTTKSMTLKYIEENVSVYTGTVTA